MIALGNANAEIVVIGRCDFAGAAGAATYGLAELLSRAFPTCILPTEPHLRHQSHVVLPNGRRLPVCADTGRIRASFLCDLPWDAPWNTLREDRDHAPLPPDSLRYACLGHDPGALPPRWTRLLDGRFDLLLAASSAMAAAARAARVRAPVAVVPIPLDLDGLLARAAPPRDRGRVRFGALPDIRRTRDDALILLDAFQRSFGDLPDAELALYADPAPDDGLAEVRGGARRPGAANVTLGRGGLSAAERSRLLRSFDILVDCSRDGGSAPGPREALALGQCLVLSDVAGHRDLAGLPGVFLVPAEPALPARGPGTGDDAPGWRGAVRAPALSAALERALAFARSTEGERTRGERRTAASEFDFSRLADGVAALVDPSLESFRRLRPPSSRVSIPAEFRAVVEQRLGRRAARLSHERRRVVAAHDGGFFSLFNAFMSHLAWDQRDGRCHGVLPDWDVDRFLTRQEGAPATSFCYGRPEDGNLWLRLFEPLYDHAAAEMQDEAALYRDAGAPWFGVDHAREPLMTFVHAYELYRSRAFAGWRRQYHHSFRAHVRLRPELAVEVEHFVAARLDRPFRVAAHVRHPSHTVEQPGALIAHADGYVERIRAVLRERGIDPEGPGWGVFLATDQERVVRRFREAFGARVACFDDVRRTRADEDAAFDALSPAEQNRDGHQLQHLVAASPDQWSVRMAWEVVRDAYVMARCNVLLHVVSNVSTAVAYMNPDLDMIFCAPDRPGVRPDAARAARGAA